jgi:starvation-inducible DNA-binding protein
MPRSPRSSSAARRSTTQAHAGATATATNRNEARPITGQRGREIQPFGTIARIPNGLSEKVCKASVTALNQVLVDTMTLRDLYKKHHWQVAGHTFYSLHLLFDKHYEEQAAMVDTIAERIQLLGGLAIAMARCRSRSPGCSRRTS